jgi:hypothetical protein
MIHILVPVFVVFCGIWVGAVPVAAQSEQEETLGGPDSHETSQGPHGHLFGEWGGERMRLLERGVRFDFQYASDSLWNIESQQKERFASWNRFRWTVDIDFGKLIGQHDLYFHATALWQAGGNLGAYLGLLTSPSGMSSMNACRLDSWWIEKRGSVTYAAPATSDPVLRKRRRKNRERRGFRIQNQGGVLRWKEQENGRNT